ncbi:hypothetical protein FJ938_20770 [Mesorhizobium sp. B2-4-14]|uniref:hypothetical protein n=1 Tax=Mesorhizobium sp. B2-4-14 TaxID=2589935 RepID=UPI00112CD56F|nr:hypothetical protein [Mesorhizobium sp. B2-4-14]TPL01720.1 hypothetical protein FJ938_20770 [Mesorhizobium sp. B2-4-14]
MNMAISGLPSAWDGFHYSFQMAVHSFKMAVHVAGAIVDRRSKNGHDASGAARPFRLSQMAVVQAGGSRRETPVACVLLLESSVSSLARGAPEQTKGGVDVRKTEDLGGRGSLAGRQHAGGRGE